MVAANLQLPISVVTNVDVARLVRELAQLDEQLQQDKIRSTTAPAASASVQRISGLLQDLVEFNTVDLRQADQRSQLQAALAALRKQAPVLHISFATDPAPQFLGKLVGWFRAEVHPWALLQVGMQPSIAAGCTLRTSNKFFDFSMRKSLEAHQDQLLAELGSVGK